MLETSNVFRNLSKAAGEKAEEAMEKAEKLRDEYNFDFPEVCSQLLQYITKPSIQPFRQAKHLPTTFIGLKRDTQLFCIKVLKPN